MNRVYVGLKISGGREAFRSAHMPTEGTHGDRYRAVIGPFRTARGARFMVQYGEGNPHVQTVGDAERLAKQS